MKTLKRIGVLTLAGIATAGSLSAQAKAPNILYIMSDDHGSQSIGAYATTLKEYVKSPNLDRLRDSGVRMDGCYAGNSISSPSRASILTGQHSHHNGVYTLFYDLPKGKDNVAKELQKGGYRTAIVGKWHLGGTPEGFNHYSVVPGQGLYMDPIFIEKGVAEKVVKPGYSTDVIADMTIQWIRDGDKESNKEQPFFIMCHFKAPHTPFTPAPRHEGMYDNITFPEPDNLYDDYDKRPTLNMIHSKIENNREVDRSLPVNAKRKVSYQSFIRKYLSCTAAIDENVGKLLDYLKASGQLDNTIVIYTSDQGFFMGEHGLIDKRLMYDESIKMPLIISYGKEIKAGSTNTNMVMNIDFAPTILDFAGIETPSYMDGKSFRENLKGETPKGWRQSIYYRYWTNFNGYNIPAHYGIRTPKYKLIYYYGKSFDVVSSKDKPDFVPNWELYDLENDPMEMNNVYGSKKYSSTVKELKEELAKLQKEAGDDSVF